MHSRRKSLLLIVLATFAISAVGYGLYTVAAPQPPQPGDARAKYERIQEGMTEADVIQIMTVPDADYTTRPYERDFCGTLMPREIYREVSGKRAYKSWIWDDGCVSVAFDINGVIASKSFDPLLAPRPVLERIGEWVRCRLR